MGPYFKQEEIERMMEIICSPFLIKADSGSVKIPNKVFDGMQPMINTVYNEKFFSSIDEYAIFADVRPNVLSGRFDQTVLVSSNDGTKNIGVFRAKTVNPRECRGRVQRIYPEMVEYLCGYMDLEKKKIITSRTIWGLRPNATDDDLKYSSFINEIFQNKGEIDYKKAAWVPLTSNLIFLPNAMPEANTNIQIAQGVQFANQYTWRVFIKEEDHIGMVLPTTPEGSKEIFKLRDIPAGKNRRAALRNWISEHCRKKPHNEDEKVFVRKHMRGAHEFTWNGLTCKILPSQEALKELQRIKDEA